MGKQKHFSRACRVEDSTLFCFFSLFACSQFSFFGLCVQYLFKVGTIAILLLKPVCLWVNKSIFPEHWEIIPFLFHGSFGLFIKIPYRVLNVPVLNRAWLSFLISEMDVSSGPAELVSKGGICSPIFF